MASVATLTSVSEFLHRRAAPQPAVLRLVRGRLPLVLRGHSINVTSRWPVQTSPPGAPSPPHSTVLYLNAASGSFLSRVFACVVRPLFPPESELPERRAPSALCDVSVRAPSVAGVTKREALGARMPPRLGSGCAHGCPSPKVPVGLGQENSPEDRGVRLRWLGSPSPGDRDPPRAPWWPALARPPHAGKA